MENLIARKENRIVKGDLIQKLPLAVKLKEVRVKKQIKESKPSKFLSPRLTASNLESHCAQGPRGNV